MHWKAVRMLAATTVLWCISFPLVKALTMLMESLLPGAGSWFQASLISVTRFGCATLLLFLVTFPTLRRLTRLEVWEGAGLGFFAAGGILLQTDGLVYTSASISAFLTQTFCIWVPVIVAFRDRRLPTHRVVVATMIVLLGVAVLNNVRLGKLPLGRGEWETLLSAVFFAGQIVWLERPLFSGNNPSHFSLVMFLTMTLLSFPILAATWNRPGDVGVIYSSPAFLVLVGALVLFCTIGAFVLMNRWQPLVPATEAAIIYGAEPVLASTFALFLPAIISRRAGIEYTNEVLTWQLIAGGGLIVTANLYLQSGWFSRGPAKP